MLLVEDCERGRRRSAVGGSGLGPELELERALRAVGVRDPAHGRVAARNRLGSLHRLQHGRLHGDLLVEPGGYVDETSPDVEDARPLDRVGRCDEGCLQLLAGPAGVRLFDEGCGTCNVRSRHRGAGEPGVGAVHCQLAERPRRPGSDDVGTGSSDLGLDRVVTKPGAARRERGQGCLLRDRADRQRRIGRAGSTDGVRRAGVAGGDDKQAVRVFREPVHCGR